MSSGAKQLVQIAKETVIGTVPSPFARQTLAFTDISLNQSVEKTESASITDNRLQQSLYVAFAITPIFANSLKNGISDVISLVLELNDFIAIIIPPDFQIRDFLQCYD